MITGTHPVEAYEWKTILRFALKSPFTNHATPQFHRLRLSLEAPDLLLVFLIGLLQYTPAKRFCQVVLHKFAKIFLPVAFFDRKSGFSADDAGLKRQRTQAVRAKPRKRGFLLAGLVEMPLDYAFGKTETVFTSLFSIKYAVISSTEIWRETRRIRS